MKTINLGIIGCGKRLRGVTRRTLALSPRIKVAALCDPSAESIKQTLDEFNPQAKVYKDYRDLVKDSELDWIMIGSWNCFHKDHVVAAFKAGKHVYCEKPLGTSLSDCKAMHRAWKASGKLFSIGFTLRYSPHYRKIRKLIDEGAIGDIISMEFNEILHYNHGGYIMADWRRLKENAGTHLLEKCSHDIDLANWITESQASRVASFGGLDFFVPKNNKHIKRVGKNDKGRKAYRTWPSVTGLNPFTADKDIVDNQVIIIEYENNVRATFHINCNAEIPERRMFICGTEGTIRADVIPGNIEIARIGVKHKIKNVSTGVTGGHGGGDAILSRSLADSMLKGKAPFTSLEDGLKSAITCFGIDQAMEKGKVVNMQPLWKRIDI
jgi:predicted dehydrogenase